MRRLAKAFCRECGNEWNFEVDVEYGITNLINNGDVICKECGFETDDIEIIGRDI